MIKFKNIDITAYKSIFHCYLDFKSLKGKLYSLEGVNNTVDFASSNGAGKSTIISALMFALYGTTDDNVSIKKADYQNINTKIKLKLELELEIQDEDYKIIRTDKEFKLFKGEEDISELTKTDTEKKFQSILNLTKAEFCNFTYLSQSSSGSFLTKTPSEKMNCIKDFIFGEELLNIQNKLDSVVKNTKKDIDDVKLEISSLEGSIRTLNNYIEKSVDEEKANAEFEKQNYDSVDVYQNKISEYESMVKEKSNIERNLTKFKSESNTYKKQMDKLKQDFEKAKNNICPTCGQHLADDKVLNNIKSNAKTVKQSYLELKSKIDELEKQLEEYPEDIMQNIKKLNNIISEIKQHSKTKADTDKMKQELLKHSEKAKILVDKNEDMLLKLKQLQQLQKYFKTDFIQYIQQAFLAEIENYLNIFCYDIFNEDFKLTLNNNALDLTIGNKPYSYFSGAERQRIDFIFVFAIKVALNNFTNKCTNLFICDESLSGQDSQAFENCIELISNLTEAENLTTILVSHRDIDYQKNKIIINRYNDKTELNVIEQ